VKIFLAGATGVVGRRLGPRLVAAGHDVLAVTRDPDRAARLRRAGMPAVVLDVLDAGAVRAALEGFGPDLVMHQLTDLSTGSSAANARLRRVGTRHLVDAARGLGVGAMVAQSIAWAYEPGSTPADEAVPLDTGAPPPREVTVAAVEELERAVATMPRGVVLRYGALYGPGTWYAEVGRIAEQVRAGGVPATRDVTSFLHVDDAVTAAVQSLGWPAGPVNVVDDDPATGLEWLAAYSAALGGPAPAVDLAGPTRTRPVSNARAAALGWRPAHPTWRTGLIPGAPARSPSPAG